MGVLVFTYPNCAISSHTLLDSACVRNRRNLSGPQDEQIGTTFFSTGPRGIVKTGNLKAFADILTE